MSNPIIIRDERSRDIALGLIGKLNLSKSWEIIVRPRKSKRSLDQNALMWMWLGIIARETGNSPNDVHEWCKSDLLPVVSVNVGGRVHECRRSTTELTTAQMTEYLDRLSAWAATDLGIALPHPDDIGRAA